MEEERKDVATRYLRLVTKTLEPHQLLMLVRAKPCSNPLFLRMTCDEMIASAVFETVETTIKRCTDQRDCLQLCTIALERFEGQARDRHV